MPFTLFLAGKRQLGGEHCIFVPGTAVVTRIMQGFVPSPHYLSDNSYQCIRVYGPQNVSILIDTALPISPFRSLLRARLANLKLPNIRDTSWLEQN